MASNTGIPFSKCLCCVECQDNAKDFQKIVDLKNVGLIIYRHMMKIQDKKMGTDEVALVAEETFIIENTKDQDITSAQYLPEIEQNKISCLRCRKIFEHAQRLLQTIPNLDKNVVRGICDHCLMEQKSCYECEQVIQKFLSKAKELPENTKNFIKQWLFKVKNVLKSIDIDDDIIKESRLKKSRTSSDLYVDRLLIKSPKQTRERYFKQLFLPQSPLPQKTVGDNRIVCLEKGKAVDQPVTDARLKEKRLKIIESIPPVPITSKQELLEGSFEHVEPSTRPKSSHYKNIIMKPDDMDQLFGSAYKRKQDHSLRKYHSDESLLTIAEMVTKTDAKMRKDFSYFFPKKKKYVYPKRFASSSELIKETQDILQEKAEAERKKREMKILHKLDIQEKKKKARAAKKAKDKEKSSKEPHRSEDGTFRYLTSMGQSSSTTGVHKRDKSHKIKGITPSKTADFENDKDEKYSKGDTSKSKTGYAKTDREKDIRVDQKEEIGRQGKEQKYKEKADERTPKELRQRDKEGREQSGKGKVNERTPKEQKQRDKEEREKPGKGKVDERTPKESKQKDKEEREKSGKGKVDGSTPKDLRQRDKEEKEKSGKGKVDGSTPKDLRQRDKEEKEKSAKGKVDGSTPKDQRQSDKEEKEKSGKGKVDGSTTKEQKQKEDKVKSPGQLREVEQKTKDKKGEDKQMQPDKTQKEKKETADKSTETPAKDKKQKVEKENTKQDKEKDEKGESKKDKEQQLKQAKDKEGKEKTTKEKEEELNEGTEKVQRDAREAKDTISAKAQAALLGLGQEKQKKETDTKQEKEQKEKNVAESTISQKGKSRRDQEQKETPSKKEEELPQETKKIERDAREAKETISAKAQEALLGLIGQNKQQKDKEPKQEKEKRDSKSGSGKTASGKSKKSKKDKPHKKKMPKEDEETEKQPEPDIAPKSRHGKRNLDEPADSDEKVAIDKIKVRRASPDDMILRLVRLKQSEAREKPKELGVLKALGNKLKKQHKPHKSLHKKCIMCMESDLEFDLDSLFYEKKPPKFEEIIIGSKIYKYTPPFLGNTMEGIEPSTVPQLFTTNFEQDDKMDAIATILSQSLPSPVEKAPKDEAGGLKIPQKNDTQSKKTAKQPKISPSAELEASKGIVHYSLSDRSFIEKGWTMLPTEKVVRKMNVYRMRPAQPEFDWFEHNRNKGQMTYDTGEVLAEFDDNGRGRWFYRNGRLALDYYDAEEMNASQRFVIWSSGEPDERGRAQPYTILATFDYLGNGIVFDHSGKIRLKYNQTEGIILDRKIGPVSHWKWHTLNDPPVLQQVMIDTHMAHKDPTILKLGGVEDEKYRPENDDMLAIEFDNFIKEKSKKLTQSFKPFQIKMKALKINENFSLRVMDQASVYLIYRDGTTNLKMNMGMILDHKEIVDTDTAEVGEVSNNIERLPAKTDSLAGLQKSVAYAQCFERMRSARERRLRLPQAVASADRMTAAASRPLRPPLRSIPSDTSTTAVTRTGYSCSRKPTKSNIYYDSRLF